MGGLWVSGGGGIANLTHCLPAKGYLAMSCLGHAPSAANSYFSLLSPKTTLLQSKAPYLDVMAHANILRISQEICCEFKVSLGYIENGCEFKASLYRKYQANQGFLKKENLCVSLMTQGSCSFIY